MTIEAARSAIAGVWRLVAYGDRETEQAPWAHTFGDAPTGIAVYDATGVLSMQVFADPTSDSEPRYVGYVGTYRVREARRDADGITGVLEHRMESASDPELLTEDSARPFTLSGDRLMLGDGRTWRRLFERVV